MAPPENLQPMEMPDGLLLEIPCHGSYLGRIRNAVADLARKIGFNEDEIARIEIAVGEACSNILKHAYAPGKVWCRHSRDPQIRLDARNVDDQLVVELNDHGARFDFASYQPADIDRNLRKMDAGGYGISIIRQMMDEVQYSSNDQTGNTVRMVKYLKKT